MDYDTIKALAKAQKCRVSDLVALAPNNDPFYFGTPADQVNGRWFAELWTQFGYSRGIHIRRAHYQIISQSAPVPLPNGKPYENTESCWDFVNVATKAARYLGLVDASAFIDRRNPPPMSFIPEDSGSPWLDVENDICADIPRLPEFPELPDYTLADYQGSQHYHVEIWAEKSTMNDVLIPLCKRYGTVLQTGLGELSITAVRALVQRIRNQGRPARIMYVSDFDPAGQSMPVAVARKIEFELHKHALDLDVRLIPFCLTAEQVREYGLPRTPIKESERRAASFEARFGAGAVELDALEALYPGELRRLLSAAIETYFDVDLARRVQRAQMELNRELDAVRQAVIESHRHEIDALEREYSDIREAFSARTASHTRQLQQLWNRIEHDLRLSAPDLDDFPIPEPESGDELKALYDSARDYLEQLSAYKAFQGK